MSMNGIHQAPLFVFDLDSTVTEDELLPLLAREVGMEARMRESTEHAMRGATPFERSFSERVGLLTDLSLKRAREIAKQMPVNPHIAAFLRRNARRCLIVTGNLDVWIAPLMQRLHMQERFRASHARVNADGIEEIEFILDKGRFVQTLPRPFIAIGDGDNDVEMIRMADLGIAFGGVRSPSPRLLAAADCRVDRGDALCALLERYL